MAGLFKFMRWVYRAVVPEILENIEQRQHQKWFKTDILTPPRFYCSSLIRMELSNRGIRDGVFVESLVDRLAEMLPTSRKEWHDRAKTIVDGWVLGKERQSISRRV